MLSNKVEVHRKRYRIFWIGQKKGKSRDFFPFPLVYFSAFAFEKPRRAKQANESLSRREVLYKGWGKEIWDSFALDEAEGRERIGGKEKEKKKDSLLRNGKQESSWPLSGEYKETP